MFKRYLRYNGLKIFIWVAKYGFGYWNQILYCDFEIGVLLYNELIIKRQLKRCIFQVSFKGKENFVFAALLKFLSGCAKHPERRFFAFAIDWL